MQKHTLTVPTELPNSGIVGKRKRHIPLISVISAPATKFSTESEVFVKKSRANSWEPGISTCGDPSSPNGAVQSAQLTAAALRRTSLSVTHRPSVAPVSRLYSVAKIVEESENMVLKRNKKSFQTKVYNFLERPSGKLCIFYHISV